MSFIEDSTRQTCADCGAADISCWNKADDGLPYCTECYLECPCCEAWRFSDNILGDCDGCGKENVCEDCCSYEGEKRVCRGCEVCEVCEDPHPQEEACKVCAQYNAEKQEAAAQNLKPKTITASYTYYGLIHIPAGIPLLSVEDNEAGKPWSWYIRWNDLYYLDDKGVEHTIEGEEPQGECKRPNDVVLEDDE